MLKYSVPNCSSAINMVSHTRDSFVITLKNIAFENETKYEERELGDIFYGNLLV